MRVLCAAVAAALFVSSGVPAAAGGQVAPPAPPGQPPSTAAPVPGQVPAAPAAAPPAAPVPRTFTAPAGLIFHAVRADRVADFEKVVAYLRAALEKSVDPTVRAQAAGWRVFKASEPGPNGTVLYVFAFDPTVAGADYSLGRILADAYPDAAQLQEIWKLYQGSTTSGGSLLNLTPVPSVPPPPLATPGGAPAATPQAPAPKAPLPDEDPLRRP